jgi:hypothetical protein
LADVLLSQKAGSKNLELHVYRLEFNFDQWEDREDRSSPA